MIVLGVDDQKWNVLKKKNGQSLCGITLLLCYHQWQQTGHV